MELYCPTSKTQKLIYGKLYMIYNSKPASPCVYVHVIIPDIPYVVCYDRDTTLSSPKLLAVHDLPSYTLESRYSAPLLLRFQPLVHMTLGSIQTCLNGYVSQVTTLDSRKVQTILVESGILTCCRAAALCHT